LKDFKRTTDKLHVDTVLAYATSAVRNARNGAELADEIRTSTGIELKIINGEEEASLIYSGVRGALDLGTEKSLIVDVGGGSVEFIIAGPQGIIWKQSFEVGGQRLLEKFHKHDPIQPQEVNELEKYLSQALASMFSALSLHNPTVLVGVSGTFDTLSEIYCFRKRIPYFPEEPETPLTLESIEETHEELLTKNRAERLAIPGMIEMRVDMIVVASCLIKVLLERHAFESVRVSTWSLKEGALMEFLSG
jgi:exopolyphosphatase/guanosine-5'-triphosphate,3'-diphosphate pyrophosphatase